MQYLFLSPIPGGADGLVGIREGVPLGVCKLEYTCGKDDDKQHVQDVGGWDGLCGEYGKCDGIYELRR